MKVPTLPRFRTGDFTSEAGVNRLNQALVQIEQVLQSLDFENNFRGRRTSLQVQNGVPILVPIQASFVNLLKMYPLDNTWSNPIFTATPSGGGFNVVVTWSGDANTAQVEIFSGEA